MRLFARAPIEGWKDRLISEFNSCKFVKDTIGARITHLKPGELDITVSASPALTQQDGFFHAGVSTSLADTAAGFAAYTLFQNESEHVLTTELKINLLNPAVGDEMVARGRVIKSGKTLSIVKADVYCKNNGKEAEEIHVATMLATMFAVKNK